MTVNRQVVTELGDSEAGGRFVDLLIISKWRFQTEIGIRQYDVSIRTINHEH